MRSQQNVLVTRIFRIDIHTGHVTIKPFANRAISVVVKTVHTYILERSVGFLAVPALPNGCCTLRNWIQPRWIVLAVKQHKGQIVVTISRQCFAKQRCADKTGCKVTHFLHIASQKFGCFGF